MTEYSQTVTAERLAPADRKVFEVLESTLEYGRVRDYAGWDYGDGMDNRFRECLPVESKWLNIAFQEAVKRAPVNVRPLLRVRQRRNYKGISLFTMANQTASHLVAAADPPDSAVGAAGYEAEARSLADWLVENRIEGYHGFCAGYPHPIQHLDGRGYPGQPDIVNTSFGVKALLRAEEFGSTYPETVESAADFATVDLEYRPVEDGRGAVTNYHTKHDEDYYTINAGALCARLYLDLYAHFGDTELRERAEGLLDHIADLQTDRGGWMYRDPPEASHLTMDNHHNGFIIETFQRYRAVTGAKRYRETRAEATQFYRRELFDADGAPNFDESNAYPRDIHASTQGALVFTYAGDLDFARRILEWVFENLYVGDGRFYFLRAQHHTKRVTLMRWCTAWMAFAMSEYLAARALNEGA